MKLLCKATIAVFLSFWIAREVWAGGQDLADAERLMDEGQLAEAVEILSRRVDKDPDSIVALRLRALAQSGLGRFDAAIEDYERIVEEDPDDAEAHFDLGMILALKKKDAKHALVHLDRYLALLSHHDEFENEEKAQKVARLMVSVDAKPSDIREKAVKDLLEMARRFASEGKTKIAVQAYERALRIHPTCAECHELLGQLFIQERNHTEGNSHRARAKLFRSNG